MPIAMSVVDRKQALFENIVRLRRVGRALPGSEDVYAVRRSLERELGETVSRRLAARVLGVSHTALDRRIKAGDLPLVYSAEGRVEVPVPAHLDLYESVDADRAGGDRRYVLAPTMVRRRQAAQSLDLQRFQRDADRSGHDRARARAAVSLTTGPSRDDSANRWSKKHGMCSPGGEIRGGSTSDTPSVGSSF
jgi:hypothetical protein